MISNHKLQTSLEEIREISKVDLALYSDKGQLVTSTYEPDGITQKAVLSFIDSMAEIQMIGGSHYFKIIVDQELYYILVTTSDAEDAYLIGRLASCQIRNLTSAYMEQSDRNHFMQNILLGNMLVVDMYNKAQKLHIEQSDRVVYVIDVENKKESGAVELLKNIFTSSSRDFITELDDKHIILIKDVRDIKENNDGEIGNIASVIVDNLQTEAMVKVRVGYGTRVYDLKDIAKSYQEAMTALAVGSIFYMERQILSYDRLGVGRMLYGIPKPLCRMFIKETFGDEIPDILYNDETTATINKFFENNLNISETARQMYVHRNTLVYRLERIERAIGLDIRTFEDAMTFKIAMMVLSYLQESE